MEMSPPISRNLAKIPRNPHSIPANSLEKLAEWKELVAAPSQFRVLPATYATPQIPARRSAGHEFFLDQ